MKQHAKDYLNEQAEQSPPWLKVLIYAAIETNGNIEAAKLNEIYNLIKVASATDDETEIAEVESVESPEKILLKSLSHNSGVNALYPSQSICFSEHCTVLFGLNGSGKSSYFKVLNEVVGGNEKKNILPNIYTDTPSAVDVCIDYQLGTSTNTLAWRNTTRSIAPLSVIKVFDSSYTQGLLGKRVVDSALVEPFGLHLFSYIIEIVDKFKSDLQAEANSLKSTKPTINTEKFSETMRHNFVQHRMSVTDEQWLREKFVFSDDEQVCLTQLEEQASHLKQHNIQDKIKIETSKAQELNKLSRELQSKFQQINALSIEVKQLLETYQIFQSQSLQFKQQTAALEAIPATDTDEWKKFISAATNYSSHVEDSESVCVYCRQPLQGNAIEIVKAYAKYLNNGSELKLNQTVQQIEGQIRVLEAFQINLVISQDLKMLLKERMCQDGRSVCQTINALHKQINKTKNRLLKSLITKCQIDGINPIEYTTLLQTVASLEQKIQETISTLNQDESEKQKALLSLQEQIQPMIEHQSIAAQSDVIAQWLEMDKEVKKLTQKNDAINTRGLSTLAKTAHAELLTENLKTKFKEELAYLGFGHFEIELSEAGVSKGVSTTKLLLKNRDDVTAILSEGEQKAIALSVFIAEARMQLQSNPIIFDDPVNSLDHKIAASFAKRLLELDNQTIIFTHNKLFLDAFETAKNGTHICKNINGGCNSQGKHIFLYSIQSEGQSAKGVVRHKKVDKAETHFNEAKNYLSEIPFSKNLEVSSRLRKTIECLIDEMVFNNQVPTKYTSKNNRIHWDELKRLNNDPNVIDRLKNIHDRVSGGDLHNGTESEEDGIEKDEFDSMVLEIESIIAGV